MENSELADVNEEKLKLADVKEKKLFKEGEGSVA